MDNLADKIIQANEREAAVSQSGDAAPSGYHTDDLGMWVEDNLRDNKARYAEYIFVRCRKRNRHLYYDSDLAALFNRHTKVEPTVNCILELANIPDMITAAQAIWVYNKLKETAPRLDRSKIVVAPGLAWNIKSGKLEEIKGEYYTVGGDDE